VNGEDLLPWRVKALVSREIAADVLSVSVRHVDALVNQGELASRRAGRRTLICVRSILEWVGEIDAVPDDQTITDEVQAVLRQYNS
tara:strand:- start:837 stop:1094 length:258 start_codon:yes stop_codon:yes gene_type:complete